MTADHAPKAVWKFPLDAPDQEFMVPSGAEVLTVATQHGTPTLWLLVTPGAPLVARQFVAHGTGHTIVEQDLTYVGTAHDVSGLGLVFHIFERTP